MKKFLIFVFLIFQLSALSASADDSRRITFTLSPNVSKNGQYFTKVDKEKKETICYKKATEKEIWNIQEETQNIFISDDGQYGIVVHKVLSQKKYDDTVSQTAIEIFKNGEKVKELSVKDIIVNSNKGQKYGKEFFWGRMENIFKQGFIINTRGNYKFFDFEKNDFADLDDEKNFTKWTYDELIDYSLRLDSSEICEYYNFMIISNIEPPNNKISFSYKGTYGGSTVAPAEEWDIDEKGYLLIGRDSANSSAKVQKNYILIKKIP